MKMTWEELYDFVLQLPCDNAGQSSVVGYMLSMLMDIEENAKSGKFFQVTTKYHKFFQFTSDKDGMSLEMLQRNKSIQDAFTKTYGGNPVSLITSFDRSEISIKAS